MADTLHVTVLFIRQPEGFWLAQGLEYDLAAQGSSVELAKEGFERTFLGQLALDRRMNRKPLSTLERAPQKFWDLLLALLKRRPQLNTVVMGAAENVPPD